MPSPLNSSSERRALRVSITQSSKRMAEMSRDLDARIRGSLDALSHSREIIAKADAVLARDTLKPGS